MRNAINKLLRVLGILCILAGIVLWCGGCATDAQGNSRLFGMVIGTDGKSHFSAEQAAKDSHDPQMQAQASLLGPWGAPGLEALGGIFLVISHLNKRTNAETQRHTVETLAQAPAILPGVLTTPATAVVAAAPQV